MRKNVTLGTLIAHHACPSQLAIFKRTFGVSADYTIENAKLAAKNELHFWWAVDFLLDGRRARYFDLKAKLFARRHKESVRTGDWGLMDFDIGWTAFAAAALDLDLKRHGYSFDTLKTSPLRQWWRRMQFWNLA